MQRHDSLLVRAYQEVIAVKLEVICDNKNWPFLYRWTCIEQEGIGNRYVSCKIQL
jgi:hypothetical protein